MQEALEAERARALLTEAIALAEEKVLARQAQEMEGLLKRLMGARDDLLRQRQLDHDRYVISSSSTDLSVSERHLSSKKRSCFSQTSWHLNAT